MVSSLRKLHSSVVAGAEPMNSTWPDDGSLQRPLQVRSEGSAVCFRFIQLLLMLLDVIWHSKLWSALLRHCMLFGSSLHPLFRNACCIRSKQLYSVCRVHCGIECHMHKACQEDGGLALCCCLCCIASMSKLALPQAGKCIL